MFKSIQFPCEIVSKRQMGEDGGHTAGIAYLDTSLADVERNDFAHDVGEGRRVAGRWLQGISIC